MRLGQGDRVGTTVVADTGSYFTYMTEEPQTFHSATALTDESCILLRGVSFVGANIHYSPFNGAVATLFLPQNSIHPVLTPLKSKPGLTSLRTSIFQSPNGPMGGLSPTPG
ncbi:hypothetical protein NQ176_g7145 [Zarea fungicola]|uniref:Uncharacterized protein n=1 Tax=Zarea fungicola TaxID=93591 RepID=A0ACC1N1U6_9HYPO|nr:hypothetical protein NQ176_g7145 [Lecanicillium fungicola]